MFSLKPSIGYSESVADQDFQSAVDKVVISFAPLVKTLPTSIYTYHYVTLEKLTLLTGITLENGLIPLSSNLVPSLVSQMVDMISDSSRINKYGGFFVATDPVGSRDFGYLKWILYRVEMPEGTNYLDLGERFHPNGVKFSLDTRAALAKLGCMVSDTGPFLDLGIFGPSVATAPCLPVAIAMFKKMNIDAVAYNWIDYYRPPGADVLGMGCSERRKIISEGKGSQTFDLISNRFTKNMKIFAFDQLPTDSESLRELAILNEILKERSPKLTFVDSRFNLSAPIHDKEAYIKSNIMCCQ